MEEFPVPAFDQWRAEVERLLKGAPFEKRMLTKTNEGITLQPIYRQNDLDGLPFLDSLPGFAPFVRGNRPFISRQDAWQVAQEIDYPTPEEFSTAVKRDLSRGLTAITLPVDRASQSGLDPDHAEVGEVGAGGVSIASLTCLDTALDGVDLAATPVYLHAGSAGLYYLGLLAALAEKKGCPLADLTGAVAMDPIGVLAAEGTLPLALEKAYDEMAAMTAWAAQNAPKLGTIWIHTEGYHDGGGNAVQALAFALATGVEYIRAMADRSIKPATTAAHIRFSFAQDANFFMETAKLRAARLLWHRVLEVCGLPEELRTTWIHARTSRYSMTVYDPYVNMLRVTTEAFSGVVGGADSLHVEPFDQPLGRADELSRRTARNVQLVLKDEVQLARIVDPAGGSWYVEHLTAELAQAAWDLFQTVEGKGGMAAALSTGIPQEEIARGADKRAEGYASRKSIQVGTNQYANPTEKRLSRPQTDIKAVKEVRTRKIEQLRTSSSHKNELIVLQKLSDLMEAEPAKTVSALIDAADRGATIGELARVLRPGSQATTTVKPIPIRRGSEAFESLRDAVLARRESKGGLKVFLATLSPVGRYMPRLDFSIGFFEVGGFEVIRTKGHDSAEDAADEALASEASIVVICGLDDDYIEGAPVVAKRIKKARPDTIVILAGKPADEDLIRRFRDAGVEDFIHVRTNVLKTLSDLASKLEVLS